MVRFYTIVRRQDLWKMQALSFHAKGAASDYIYNFIDGLFNRMPVLMADTIFRDIQERIEELEAHVDNALLNFDRLERMQNDLENM